jgi:hypothetical protein
MKAKFAAVFLLLNVLALALAVAFTVAERQRTKVATVQAQPGEEVQPTAEAVPPQPVAATELKFTEFFVSPIGDRGLTLTDKLRSLDGQRVRVLGYMARQEQPVPGMFLFNAIPVRLNEEHYGLADDLPAATLFVSMPMNRDQVVPHTPGLMLLTGTLSVGNREEADGRISTARLALEMPEPAAKKNSHPSSKGAEQLVRGTK